MKKKENENQHRLGHTDSVRNDAVHALIFIVLQWKVEKKKNVFEAQE